MSVQLVKPQPTTPEPVMDVGDAEEYTQALGQVVAGGYRQIVLGKRLGVPQALGLSVEEWVQTRLGGYVRLSIPERREAVAELSAEGMSTREIGEIVGVGKSTVDRDVAALVPNGTPQDSEVRSSNDRAAGGVPSGTVELTAAEREQADLKRQEAAEKQRRWAATLNVLDGLLHFDREAIAEQARREAALLDPLVAATRGESITPSRLRRASAWAALLADALEEGTANA